MKCCITLRIFPQSGNHLLISCYLVWLLQGITGIRFSGGDKCYIKTQVKARLPDVESLNKESMTFQLVGSSHLAFRTMSE